MATYLDLMRGGVRVLKDAGVENPVREARLLMALAGDRSTASLIACERDEISDTATIARYEALLKRRADREPFAHIAGYK
ncbi:MAG: peptide chain release factor N(5)-glutamine methyltransferase, partial [Pseudomonadota bacterium]